MLYVYIFSLLNLPHTPPPAHLSMSSQNTELSSLQLSTSYLLYTWQCIYVSVTLLIHPTLPHFVYVKDSFVRSVIF